MKDKQDEKLSIAENVLWSSFGSIVDLVCQWLISVLVVRLTTSYDAAGVYALSTSIYGIVHPIAQYKMYTFHLSDVKYEYSCGEYLAFNGITCILAMIVCVGYSLVTAPISVLPSITLYGLYRLAKVCIDVFHAEDQRSERMDFIGISLALQGVSSVLVFSLVFYMSSSLNLALFSMVCAIICIAFLFDVRFTSRLAEIHFGITSKKAIRLLLNCFPVVLASVFCSLSPSIPRQYLLLSSGESALGIYASVAAPVAIIQMGANYIYYPLLGYFAEYNMRGNSRAFKRLLAKTFLAVLIMVLICVIGVWLFGEPLLSLVYGSDIVQYSYLLYPMMFSAFLTALMWFMNDLLISVRLFRETVIGSACMLLVTLAVTAPFINEFEMNGVSYTLIASYASATIVMIALFVLIGKKAGETS